MSTGTEDNILEKNAPGTSGRQHSRKNNVTRPQPICLNNELNKGGTNERPDDWLVYSGLDLLCDVAQMARTHTIKDQQEEPARALGETLGRQQDAKAPKQQAGALPLDKPARASTATDPADLLPVARGSQWYASRGLLVPNHSTMPDLRRRWTLLTR